MPRIDAVVECPVHDSFRVRQVAGLFDVPLTARAAERFHVDLPDPHDPTWQIGLIVGPSGSGKSTIARAAFPHSLYTGIDWPHDRALIDAFPQPLSIRSITATLTSVGLSSPPTWLKPYRVLSNGEQFRCDLAMALLAPLSPRENGTSGDRVALPRLPPLSPRGRGAGGEGEAQPDELLNRAQPSLTVFDEFTSLVDRTVAQIGSAALAKSLRSSNNKKFIAITCHYDVAAWLAPDWILDMAAGGSLHRGRLRRPQIHLELRRVPRTMWNCFKRHHYLTADLHPSAACFAGFVDGRPATFTAALPFPHATRPGWREHRTVCLPDFQGVGLGHATTEFIASLYRATHKPYFSTTSHPAMIRHRSRSPLWRLTRKPSVNTSPHSIPTLARHGSTTRLTASFEYIGPPRPANAQQFGLTPSPGTPGEGRGGGSSGMQKAEGRTQNGS